MLSLQINGQYCDLGNDFSFTMNLKSPIFFSDTGSASYPFKLPNTERNRRIFSFRHRIENTSDVYQEMEGCFLWNDKVVFQGTLKLRILNANWFEGAIYEGNGSFNYYLRNKTLQNISFGELNFSNENTGLAWARQTISSDYEYPTVPCAFPRVFNDMYFGEVPADDDMKYYNQQETLLQLLYLGVRSIIIPFLYFRYVQNRLFSEMGYTLDDRFFTTGPKFNRMVLYNSVNANEAPGEQYFGGNSLASFKWDYHVPRMKICDFLSGYEKMFGVVHFVNETKKTVRIISLDDIITSVDYEDFSENIISLSTELEEKETGYELKMTTDSGDSDMEAISDLGDLLVERIKESVQSVSDLPPWPASENMDMRWVKDYQKYYQLKAKVWTATDYDEFSFPTRFVFKDRKTTIETGFSSMAAGDLLMASCKNKREDWKSITPRLMFTDWQTYMGYTWLVARNRTDDRSLFWFEYLSNNGLFEKQYKNYLLWSIGKKHVKITKQMTFNQVRDFDFAKKYMIGGVKYLIKSIQVNIKNDRIMPAIIEAYTVNL